MLALFWPLLLPTNALKAVIPWENRGLVFQNQKELEYQITAFSPTEREAKRLCVMIKDPYLHWGHIFKYTTLKRLNDPQQEVLFEVLSQDYSCLRRLLGSLDLNIDSMMP